MSLRDDILAAADRGFKPLAVPEWGITVYIQPLSGAERDQLEEWIPRGEKRTPNFRAKVAALVLVDDKGQKLFSQADVAALAAKSGAALDRVLDAALALSGLGAEALEASKKASATDPSAASGSG